MNANPQFLAATAAVDDAAIQPLPSSRKVYVEADREGDGPTPRYTLNFTVRFDPATGTLEDACATDANGNQWGAMVGTSDITENVKVRLTLPVAAMA